MGDTIRIKPTNTLTLESAAALITPTLEPARFPEASPTPEPATSAPETEPTATSTLEATPTSEPVTEAVPSLADNPLVLPESATTDVNEAPAAVPTPAESSPITRIVAESIGLDTQVIAVGWESIIREDGTPVNVWTVADYAAGWHKNSALPGQGGNIVLSGHHNIKGEVFRYTIELNAGDIVTLYEGDQIFKYVVVDKFIVKDKGEPEAIRRENAKWIGPFNEERLTLVTCWPYTNNTHRAIVIAKPVQ
jgi:sortase A